MAPVTRKRKTKDEHIEDPTIENASFPHSLAWKPSISNTPTKTETTSPPRKRVKLSPNSSLPDLTAKPVQSPSVKTPVKAKKATKYHFTPGSTPYPDHVMPTHEACSEVNRILSQAHGKIPPPKIVETPSMKTAGCGNVPDLLDALLRTRLSATTSSTNANRALEGLQKMYGLQMSGPGKGSINWNAVRRSEVSSVTEAIKRGGHQNVKARDIKEILEMVFKQNVGRLEFLNGKKASDLDPEFAYENIDKEPESEAARTAEISQLERNMLSLDRISKMKPFEAMEEMMKFKGIGVKTSSCVLLFCMHVPSFAVDTHVWRLCRWLGWVPEKADRDRTYGHCDIRVPDILKFGLHQLLIIHGKRCYRCKSNTSVGSRKWEETVCPIEELVDRGEGKGKKDVKVKKDAGKNGDGGSVKRKVKKEVIKAEEGETKKKRVARKKAARKQVVESDSDEALSDIPSITEEGGDDGEYAGV